MLNSTHLAIDTTYCSPPRPSFAANRDFLVVGCSVNFKSNSLRLARRRFWSGPARYSLVADKSGRCGPPLLTSEVSAHCLGGPLERPDPRQSREPLLVPGGR